MDQLDRTHLKDPLVRLGLLLQRYLPAHLGLAGQMDLLRLAGLQDPVDLRILADPLFPLPLQHQCGPVVQSRLQALVVLQVLVVL